MSKREPDLASLRIDDSEREYHSESPNKRLIVIFTLVVLIVIALIAFWSYAGDIVLNPAPEVTLVRATLQTPESESALLTASGYIVAQRKASVASKGTGRLVYLGVVEGDEVAENEIIARLEDNDIQAQLAETRANLKVQQAELNVAKTGFERQQALLESGASSRADFDAAESQYSRVQASIELAEARVIAAEVALENTLIRAPFDGTVLTKNADVGEIVAPLAASANSRAAVVTIADMASLQVETDVSESNIEKIGIEQPCEITLDAYPGHRYAGYVFKIVPTADRSKATVQVKVAFREYDSRVLPEMSAKVIFLDNDTQIDSEPVEAAIMVPISAIASRDGKKVVFQVEDDIARAVEIELGERHGRSVVINSGLDHGDRIIRVVSSEIEEGSKVIVN